jgi:nucleoside-diphosphate-sugar epimerase
VGGTVFFLGGTGQIGRVAVQRLAEDGWHVRAASRGMRASGLLWPSDLGVDVVHLDRENDSALAEGIGKGCDVLVDCIAFHARHAHQLRALGDRIGSVIVISSFMVYACATGRTFNAGPQEYPVLPVPVAESQPTLAPDDDTYPSGKSAVEQTLFIEGAFPVTVLRAGMVHGVGSSTPREWYFVKRALDRRQVRLLAYRGRSRCHPTSTINLAELIRLAAAHPGNRVLNAGDPQAPTVREIAAHIDAVLGREVEEILLDGPPEAGLGETPWSVPDPIVLDMRLAERELGYRPVTDYARSLPETVTWLVEATRHRDWREIFPQLASRWGLSQFDYAAEDRWLAGYQKERDP